MEHFYNIFHKKMDLKSSVNCKDLKIVSLIYFMVSEINILTKFR